MDAQKTRIDHENIVSEALYPTRCLIDVLVDLIASNTAVCPVSVGYNFRALVEKCATDLIAAMDTANHGVANNE